MARLVAVAATDDEAERDRPRRRGVDDRRVRPRRAAPEHGARSPTATSPPASRATSTSASCGAQPARVRDELARLAEEMRLDYLMIAPLSHDSFVRFTDEVLPHL